MICATSALSSFPPFSLALSLLVVPIPAVTCVMGTQNRTRVLPQTSARNAEISATDDNSKIEICQPLNMTAHFTRNEILIHFSAFEIPSYQLSSSENISRPGREFSKRRICTFKLRHFHRPIRDPSPIDDRIWNTGA